MSELINEFLIEEALILIPVLLIFGKIIKETPILKNWIIPYVLLFSGVIFSIALLGFNVQAIIQGILVAGAAVFGNQLYKQGRNRQDP